jgi:hypothetical protein
VRTIPLTQGKEALVDDCDYEYLTQWKWRFERGGHRRTGYAVCWDAGSKLRKLVKMHRLVAERGGLTTDGKQIDHVDGNGLNNCRDNLRLATSSQNRANLRRARNNTSGFKGVQWHRQNGRFRAYIRVAGRQHHLKYFHDPRDAARAYNEAALKHFGEFACLNPV